MTLRQLLSTAVQHRRCSLCLSRATRVIHQDGDAHYCRCEDCRLIFQHGNLPTPSDELSRYNQHENCPQDKRYRKFLSPLIEAITARVPRNSVGLDFGCGPGPTLSVMLQEAGRECEVYDPFFRPDQEVIRGRNRYDYIVSSETFEHFHKPRVEIELLHGLLKPEGWLGVMTSQPGEDAKFASWHYHRDPTHVCFWAQESFEYCAM